MKCLTYKAIDESTLIGIANKIGKQAKGNETILLSGDLGAGKTVFAKALAKGFGIVQHVTSPTFTIMNTYTSDRGEFIHIDLYRIENPDEVEYLGIHEYLGNALVIVEWPERFSVPPESCLMIEIVKETSEHRTLVFSARGNEEALLKELNIEC